MVLQRKLILKRNTRDPTPSDFEFSQSEFEPTLAPNQIFVQVQWLSIDAAMRIWVSGVRSYTDPVLPGQVMHSFGVGLVLRSTSQKFKAGETVYGSVGWQDYGVYDDEKFFPVPQGVQGDVYLSSFSGSGSSALFSFELGEPKQGETLVVSSAAGSVGSLQVQLGKAQGLRVVGLAGSDQKCQWVVNQLGADACINYKTAPDLAAAISQHCPNGYQLYIDNVGGRIFDAVLASIEKYGRIVICGAISTYGSQPEPIKNYANVPAKSLKLKGFMMLNYLHRMQEADQTIQTMLNQGKLRSQTYLIEGLRNAPNALVALMNGENIGKTVVRVDISDARL